MEQMMEKKLLMALVLLEVFATINEECEKREGCKDCPFYDEVKGQQACIPVSTARVLQVAGDFAREYLFKNGLYPIPKEVIKEIMNSFP